VRAGREAGSFVYFALAALRPLVPLPQARQWRSRRRPIPSPFNQPNSFASKTPSHGGIRRYYHPYLPPHHHRAAIRAPTNTQAVPAHLHNRPAAFVPHIPEATSPVGAHRSEFGVFDGVPGEPLDAAGVAAEFGAVLSRGFLGVPDAEGAGGGAGGEEGAGGGEGEAADAVGGREM